MLKKKKWNKTGMDDDGKLLTRSFCAFIMEPIIRLARSIMDGDKVMMNKMLVAIDLVLKQEEKVLEGKHLLKLVMAKWINAADTLLEMMVSSFTFTKSSSKI